MSDIKLFAIAAGGVTELAGHSVQIEKSLQNLFEANLEALLGVRFLAGEFSTGPVHGGRIDTLGLDENGCPVIIEYKRAINENVINQGLFYLDWLMDHRGDFERLIHRKLGADVAETVDWSAPRLLCIAGDFTRYDEHAVKQINRNIELLRYRRFGGDLLMIDLIHAPKATRSVAPQPAAGVAVVAETPAPGGGDAYQSQRIDHRIAAAPADVRDVYEAVRDYLIGLGDDVQQKELKFYMAFKRIKNFACVEVYPKARTVTLYLKLDPSTVALEKGFTRDVRKIGHFGTGDLEVSLKSMPDFTRAQALMREAYERG